MKAILKFRHTEFANGRRKILGDLNFSIAAGEMVALIGPNGVGKTTLLRIIAGLIRPTAGDVDINGAPLREWSRKQLSQFAALVPQFLEVPFGFTVREIVSQGRVPYLRRFHGLSAHDQEIVENAMRSADVLSLADRMFTELSGGERQRVKIALGIAQQPELMLLDEPMQHLDLGRQIETANLMRRLNDKGMTIIAAMHDLAQVREHFTSVILLTPEPRVHFGSVDEILQPHLLIRAFSISPNAFTVDSLSALSWLTPAHP